MIRIGKLMAKKFQVAVCEEFIAALQQLGVQYSVSHK